MINVIGLGYIGLSTALMMAIGRIVTCLYNEMIKYKAYKNKKLAHNSGGTIGGCCTVTFP